MANGKIQNNLIMEIRAGTGGEEALLFAKDLSRMYRAYAEKKNWTVKVIEPLVLKITGQDVYKHLKYESGVHRVQRIPKTEKRGRIHTSTVTVAVLPQMFADEIKIEPKDLRIETFRASGPGGQNVNKVSSAVRITHLPSGTIISCQDEKSQFRNKAKALEILRSRLYNLEKEKREKFITVQRRQQVGTGERSEKIRTYNFPQNRLTDHRVNKSFKNLSRIMDGNLDKIIESLVKSKKKGGDRK